MNKQEQDNKRNKEIRYYKIIRPIKEEDKYLILASDGFWEYISSEKCSEIVGDYHEYVNNNCKYNLADILYKEALKMWKENDVNIDDITIIVASLE